MKSPEDRIYIKTWSEMKPYKKQAPTDRYYLKLANDVKQAFWSDEVSFQLLDILLPEEVDLLCCFLTCYFEDLISETNIWNAFVKMHKDLYGKPLPFFDAPEYFEEEINIQDVCFLIWYFINTAQDEQFYEPQNDFISDAASLAMEVFEGAWEYAPENELLSKCYQIDENETDFYKARELMVTILFETYLFHFDTAQDHAMRSLDLISKYGDDENIENYLTENHDATMHSAHTRLLALKGNIWAAEILGKDHLLYAHFRNLSPKVEGYFFYKGQDEENIFLEHIASGLRFDLTKKSFEHSNIFEEIDTICHIGIVRWGNEWWFSGIFAKSPFDADLVMDEKNSLASRSAVNFLLHKEHNVEEILGDQLKAFIDFNNGSQIAFMKASEVESFIKGFMEYINNSRDPTGEKSEESAKRARQEGYLGKNESEKKPLQFADKKNALVFFNPKSGTEIGFDGVLSAFPDEENPFFKKEESEREILNLLFAEDISPALVLFCIDNYKDKLPFFQEDFGKLYIKDIDFLLRFCKRQFYHPKPGITLTGYQKQ